MLLIVKILQLQYKNFRNKEERNKYRPRHIRGMMTLDEIRTALADRNLSYVARECGISINTIWSIMNRPDRDPLVRYRTIRILSNYLGK